MKGQGFDPHSGRSVVSLSKIHLLVIPRKRWPHPNMTEKLFTGMFSKTTTTEKHVNLKTGLNIMHLYCFTNTSIINKTTPLQVITVLCIDDVQPC